MQFDLRFIKGFNVGRSVVIGDNQRLVLGRSRETHVTFQDPLVSRKHCEISNAEGKLLVFDLKSWNGTFVNGAKISESTRLQDGDRIAIGKNLVEIRAKVGNSSNGDGHSLNVEGSTQEGWRPEKGLPQGASKSGSTPARIMPGPKPGSSWSPNMVAGYHINGKLGEGAVGTVFSAIRISDKKKVALKVIDPSYISKQNGMKRFLRAVKVCRDIKHPNVIRIFDAGESEGVYYIAMEFIAGKEVGTIINQYGHVSVPTTLQIGIQIAAALQYAYERAIVHRDIKPRNIMVNRRGVAKLVDFGLAKRLYRPTQSVITAPGEAVGTLAYMPPEQIDNALNVDHRCDTYSLGATMYHMLTGKHPFEEASFAEFVSAIMEKLPERVDASSRSIPSTFADIIDKSMQKDPLDRYQTPAELGNDLRMLAVKLNCVGKVAAPDAKTMRVGRSVKSAS